MFLLVLLFKKERISLDTFCGLVRFFCAALCTCSVHQIGINIEYLARATFAVWRKQFYVVKLKTYNNCNLRFSHKNIISFSKSQPQVYSNLKFCKFEPQYCYKIHSYKKGRVNVANEF